MKNSWRWAALKNGFLETTAYRFEFIFQILSAALIPAAIQWVIWNAIFNLGGASSLNEMSYYDMLQYTLVSVLFTQVRGGDHDFDLQEMIRTGQLSQYLLRPIGIVEFVYIRGVAARLMIACVCLIAGLIIGSFFGLSPVRMIGGMFLALLGNVIHYQIGAALSTTAFYWEEAYSVLMVKNVLVGFLSGELIPLSLFPESTQWIWKSCPFYLYVYGPTLYATGKWSHAEYLYHFGIGILWFVVCWILIKLSWSIGQKRYLSLGG